MAEIDIGQYTIRDNGDGTFDLIDTGTGETVTVNGTDLEGVQNIYGQGGAGSGDAVGFESADMDEVSITQAAPGFDYVIFQDDSGNNYVMDNEFSVVAGGPDDKNVTDNTDFAELFAYAVNNHPVRPAIKLDSPQSNAYRCKTTQTLNQIFHLWGSGKNRTTVRAQTSVAGSDIFTLDLSSGQAILRMDSVKFSAADRNDPPNMYFNLNNANEVILTDVEFRDALTWGIKSTSNVHWNYIRDSWFLNGAGFYFQGPIDLTLTGTKISGSNTNTKIEDYDTLAVAGNLFKDGAPTTTLTNVDYDVDVQAYIDSYTRDVATSNTSYASLSSFFDKVVTHSEIFPDTAITKVSLFGVNTGPTAEMSIRIQDVNQGETIAERTGITTFNRGQLIGWTDWNPTSPSDPSQLRIEIRSSDGSEVQLRNASVAIGKVF